MMENITIEEKVKQIIASRLKDQAKIDALDVHTPLLSLGIDSILALSILVEIEEAYEIEIDDSDLNMDKIKDIASFAELVRGIAARMEGLNARVLAGREAGLSPLPGLSLAGRHSRRRHGQPACRLDEAGRRDCSARWQRAALGKAVSLGGRTRPASGWPTRCKSALALAGGGVEETGFPRRLSPPSPCQAASRCRIGASFILPTSHQPHLPQNAVRRILRYQGYRL